jgi:hypothetical protein
VDSTISGTVYHFCCQGCRQVFSILYEAAGSADPEDFRRSELFKSCLAAGIIPTSEQELSTAAAIDTPNFPQSTAGQDRELLNLDLTVSGMWCPACAWVIEKTLSRLPGIGQAAIFPVTGCDAVTIPCRFHPRASMSISAAWDTGCNRRPTTPPTSLHPPSGHRWPWPLS